MSDSKTTVKRKAREQERAEFLEGQLELPFASEVDPAEAKADFEEAMRVAAAIRVLQRAVPGWPRKQRRSLANAMRQGGNGYTKNTGQGQ